MNDDDDLCRYLRHPMGNGATPTGLTAKITNDNATNLTPFRNFHKSIIRHNDFGMHYNFHDIVSS